MTHISCDMLCLERQDSAVFVSEVPSVDLFSLALMNVFEDLSSASEVTAVPSWKLQELHCKNRHGKKQFLLTWDDFKKELSAFLPIAGMFGDSVAR